MQSITHKEMADMLYNLIKSEDGFKIEYPDCMMMVLWSGVVPAVAVKTIYESVSEEAPIIPIQALRIKNKIVDGGRIIEVGGFLDEDNGVLELTSTGKRYHHMIIVDDVIDTGETIRKAIEVAKNYADVISVLSVCGSTMFTNIEEIDGAKIYICKFGVLEDIGFGWNERN